MNAAQLINFHRNNSKKGNKNPVGTNTILYEKLQTTNRDRSKIAFSPIGEYNENTNLDDIHRYVCDNLSKSKNKITQYTEKISQIQNKLDTTRLTIVDRKAYMNEIKSLEKQIEESSSDNKYNEYIQNSQILLDKWRDCVQRENSDLMFGAIKNSVPEKINYIHRYIGLASKYVELNLVYDNSRQKEYCMYCNQKYSVDDDENFYCEPCGLYIEEMLNTATFSDLSRINGTHNNDYRSKENFKNAWNYHQGKVPVDFPIDLVSRVDNYCKINHINKMNIEPQTMWEIFKIIGYKNYKSVNLFLSIYNNYKLDNYNEIEAVIFADQETFSAMYEKVKDESRSSAMNTEYLMFILLRKNGVNCQRNAFRIPTTPKTINDLETTAKKTFKALNWTWKAD